MITVRSGHGRRLAHRLCFALGLVPAAFIGGFPPALGVPASAAGARERITLMVPVRARQGRVYDVTVSGFSGKRARAYLFVDYNPCARFSVERARAPGESQVYAVRGAFGHISGWRSAFKRRDHACAYLVARRSGRVLATAAASFSVG